MRAGLTRRWAPVAGYMVVIFLLSSVSQVPRAPSGTDKVVHVALYVGLALTVLRALAGRLRAPFTVLHLALSVAITTAYGATDEFHQRFVPHRSADYRDLVADGCGALLAAGACGAWSIISSRKP